MEKLIGKEVIITYDRWNGKEGIVKSMSIDFPNVYIIKYKENNNSGMFHISQFKIKE